LEKLENRFEWQEFPADNESYPQMRDYVIGVAEEGGLSMKAQLKIELGIEETLVNVISYAYKEPGKVWIYAAMDEEKQIFFIHIVDYGVPFNPLEKDAVPSPDTPIEERKPGGYGIKFMKNTFETVEYYYEDFAGKEANHLYLAFNCNNK